MKRTGPIAAVLVADVRFARKVERLHQRGPRVVAEVLAEISAECSIGTVVDQTLDRHLALSDTALEAVGGDRLSPVPLHVVNDDDLPPPSPGEAA